MERIKSFIRALSNWARSGFKTSSQIAEDRLKICHACPEYNNGLCNDCGCILVLKTRMLSENCPQNKW